MNMVFKKGLNRFCFGNISCWGACPVSVNIIDVCRLKIAALDSLFPSVHRPAVVRCSHMIGICRSSVPNNLPKNGCSSCFCMLFCFYKKYASSFSHNESIPVHIERTGSFLWIVIICGHRLHFWKNLRNRAAQLSLQLPRLKSHLYTHEQYLYTLLLLHDYSLHKQRQWLNLGR